MHLACALTKNNVVKSGANDISTVVCWPPAHVKFVVKLKGVVRSCKPPRKNCISRAHSLLMLVLNHPAEVYDPIHPNTLCSLNTPKYINL